MSKLESRAVDTNICCISLRLFEAGQSDLERLIATDARARAENLSATPTPAIKVVGLPATANQHDVVNLLNGIELLHGADSITIVREPTSSPSAVVQLATSQAQLQALSRSNTLLHGSPVQVLPYHVVEAAVSSAALVAASVPFAPLSQGVVSSSLQNQPASEQQSFPFDTTGATLKLRGLPYSADESDVISFFQGVSANQHLHCCMYHCCLHQRWSPSSFSFLPMLGLIT